MNAPQTCFWNNEILTPIQKHGLEGVGRTAFKKLRIPLLYLARASRFVVFCPRATMAYAGILAILSLGQYCGRHAGLYTDPTGFRPTMILLRLRVCLLHGPYVSLLHMRSGNIYRNPSDTSPHRRFPPSILCPPDPKTHRTCC